MTVKTLETWRKKQIFNDWLTIIKYDLNYAGQMKKINGAYGPSQVGCKK